MKSLLSDFSAPTFKAGLLFTTSISAVTLSISSFVLLQYSVNSYVID